MYCACCVDISHLLLDYEPLLEFMLLLKLPILYVLLLQIICSIED